VTAPAVGRTTQTPAVRPDPRAPLAAFLSFLFPGLGQAYNGDRMAAWLLAVPVAALLVVAIGLILLAQSQILARFLDVRFLIGLVALDTVLLAWRLVGILEAYLRRERPGWRRWTSYATALILALTLAMHAVPGWYALVAVDTLHAVAQGGGGGNEALQDSFGGLIVPIPTPSEIPDAKHERINVLLVGIDWKPGRGEHLTDTMLVVSLDPATGQSAMISVPRDLYGARLPDGRTYNAKLNSLLIIATINKQQYPQGGVATLKGAIGTLLGVRIDYFASINLLGFKQAVDSIGGVDITVTRAIQDPTYTDENEVKSGFYLRPGRYHMNGHMALGYVRSRKGVGDSDFTRAARQQEVLTAIRAKLSAQNLLTALPGLLDAVKHTISTDVPSEQLPVLAQAVQDADLANVQRAVIQPPLVHSATGPGGAYILVPDFAAILELGQRLMGDRATAAGPAPSAGP
jgi:LCP family protein required for cell wall assembly